MDSVVIAAIIGGGVTVSTTVVAALLGNAQGKKSEKKALESALQQNAKSLQDQLAKRFQFRVARVVSLMTVLNRAGDAKVKRSFRGITASKELTISNIFGSFWVDTPGGRLKSGPELTGVDTFHKLVRLIKLPGDDREMPYRIEITGGLSSSDPPLDFDVQVEHEGAVITDPERLENAYSGAVFKYDYLAFDVEFPIDSLELEVAFPETVVAKVFPVVFLGWSEHTHDAELHRTKGGFQSVGHGGRYVVDEPVVGFRYAVYWTIGAPAKA